MKISISKKLMGMVFLPVLFICIVVGYLCTTILNTTIVNEIEKQLSVSAYSFYTEYGLTSGEELNSIMKDFNK